VPVVAAIAMVAPAAQAAPPARAASHPAANTGWRITRTFATKNLSLLDVTGFANRSARAGGSSPAQLPVVYHLAGGTWTQASLPGSTGAFVTNLSATSTSNVWAGLANEPLVARLTSTGWVTKSLAVGTDDVQPSGVVTTGPKNAWAFSHDFTTSQDFASHYNGSAWTATVLPAEPDGGSSVELESASGPGNIWSWAYNPTLKRDTTLHYDGHHWVTVGIPANLVPSNQSLDAEQILAESPVNVWATANNNQLSGSIILLHWKGRGWGRITGMLPKAELAGPIASDGHGGLWLEAYSAGTSSRKYFLEHYSGGKWTRYSLPASPFGPIALSAMHLIPGTRSVIAVGQLSPVFGTTKGSVILKYGP